MVKFLSTIFSDAKRCHTSPLKLYYFILVCLADLVFSGKETIAKGFKPEMAKSIQKGAPSSAPKPGLWGKLFKKH